MRKLLNKPWVVALLATAAIFFVVQSVRDRSRSGAVRSAQPAEAAAEWPVDDAVPVVPGETTLVEALRSLSLSENLPDPFEPRRPRAEDTGDGLERLPDETETVHLSAIWRQEDEQLAFINGRIVHAGESIGRITLETFEREGIWLTHWKGRDFLRLGQEFTLITPAANAAILETADDER